MRDEGGYFRRSSRRAGGALSAFIFLAFSLWLGGPVPLAAAERLFDQCKACHEIGKDARNKVGPHLDGLFGRKAGSVEDFNYSRAMREAGKAGLVWNEETLDAYLAKPREFIRGNRMSFRGMSSEEDRSELIAYLKQASRAEPSASEADYPETGAVRGFADAVLAMEGDPEYGEYLASECTTCHQPSGHADGIPSIVGVPRDYFVRALFEYKVNIRTNEVMKLRVSNLTNEEIAALAAYFSSLEPQ